MRRKFVFFLLCFTSILKAQKRDTLSIRLVYNSSFVEVGKVFWSKELNDSILIDKLQLYLSLPYQAGNAEKKEYRLINFASAKDCFIPFQNLTSTIKIDIGVDSLTNLNAPLINDLDPTTGMYWTWQNGFIHFKIEGSFNSGNSKKEQFQYHLGGYSYPNNSVQQLEITALSSESFLELNLFTLLTYIKKQGKPDILSPGVDAMEGMKVVKSSFSLKP